MGNISSKSQKRQSLITFLLVNAIQYPCSLKSDIYHSNKRRPPPFFHFDTNPALVHVLIHFVDKTNVLVAAVKLIPLLFLNIISFTFVLTPNKFFKKSYVNCPDVVLSSYTSYTSFLLDVRCAVQCGHALCSLARMFLTRR